MGIYAGIDVGTQSTKVLVYDSQEQCVLACTSSRYPVISHDDGQREQKAIWYTDAITNCFHAIDGAIRRRIVAIGVSGQMHGLVPLDEKGNVLGLVRIWCDTSTLQENETLTAKLGGTQRMVALVGGELQTAYTAGKILALRGRHPELYQRMRHVLLVHNYINYWLTGSLTMECGDASGTGFFDIRNRLWSEEVLKMLDSDLDWSTILPPVVQSDVSIGRLRAEIASLLGLSCHVLVSTGGGDNMMAAIGTGCVQNGRMTMSLGTSGTLFLSSDYPVTDPQNRICPFCSSTNGWLPLFTTQNCTNVIEHVRILLGLSIEEMNELAAQEPIGSRGVVFLPYFNGERTPFLPHGKVVVGGMTSGNMGKGPIARAAIESVVLGMIYGCEAFKSLGIFGNHLALTGGGAKSALWRQMVSDILGLSVDVPMIDQSAAFGGVLQAMWMSGKHGSSIEAICQDHIQWDSSKHCEPNADAGKAYREAYRQFLQYQRSLMPLFQ